MRRLTYDELRRPTGLYVTESGGGWTRRYDYLEDSLVEGGKRSNRLSKTTVGNGFDHVEKYTHDSHGNMTTMPHVAAMVWDFEDQLQQVDLGGGGTAYYVYDAAGQRARKVIESQDGIRQKQRIYLGGFEIWREYGADGVAVDLERESLHVMDDKQRIAVAETQTVKDGSPVNGPTPVLRYQLGNHLGSASVEFDEDGAVISYEEYHPYGTAAFQAGRSATEVSLKRYRYTGKERDEESGFGYHEARYYACWLGRWVCPDPIRLLTNEGVHRRGAPADASSGRGDSPETMPEDADLDEYANLYGANKVNPTNWTDPNGQDPISKGATVAAKALARRFFRELGERGARFVAGRIGRVALKELAEGLLPKVEMHILEHADDVAEKAAHSIFKSGLGKNELLALIKDAVQTGGKPVLSELSENGKIAWVFEKEFKTQVGDKGQKILRVVVDKEGRIVTAFPVENLLKRVAIKGIQVSGQLAAVAFLATLYESEAQAASADTAARYKAVEESKTWLETGLEWVGPFGLFESSPIGLEPNFGEIRARTDAARIEATKTLGRDLTNDEADLIGRDIYNIWAESLGQGTN